MDIPLHLVRTLQAVVSSGTFSRAAALLHLSQPAVSKHVHRPADRRGTRKPGEPPASRNAGLGLAICSVSSPGRERHAGSLAPLELEPPLPPAARRGAPEGQAHPRAMRAELAIVKGLRRNIERGRAAPEVARRHLLTPHTTCVAQLVNSR